MPSEVRFTPGYGVEKLVDRLFTKQGETARGMERGLLKAAQFLLAESKKVVPFRTGKLHDSGFAHKRPNTSGFKAAIDVGFSARYAEIQHETLTYVHKAGRIALYLKLPARWNKDKMTEIIRDEARK